MFGLTLTSFALYAVGTLVVYYLFTSWRRSRDLTSTPTLLAINRNIDDTGRKAKEYTAFHDVGGGTLEQRTDNAQEMVNDYYDLVTDFYAYGWGESFHFAFRNKGESHMESILHHEMYLAARLNMEPGQKLLDLGCGVGGPMRNIARFTRCNVTGINNNDYQLKKLASINQAKGLSEQCNGLKGDFMNLTLPRNSFDGAYAIEATCHAPDRTECFRQIFNVLKPGARFVTYEWVTTPKYDTNNPVHRQLKAGIEVGNALPDITDAAAVEKSLNDAGFNVIEVSDLAETAPVSWYEPFEPKLTLAGFKTTPVGIKMTNIAVKVMETLKLAPPGSAQIHNDLSVGAITLFEAGKRQIFTPMLLCVAQKPL